MNFAKNSIPVFSIKKDWRSAHKSARQSGAFHGQLAGAALFRTTGAGGTAISCCVSLRLPLGFPEAAAQCICSF